MAMVCDIYAMLFGHFPQSFGLGIVPRMFYGHMARPQCLPGTHAPIYIGIGIVLSESVPRFKGVDTYPGIIVHFSELRELVHSDLFTPFRDLLAVILFLHLHIAEFLFFVTGKSLISFLRH